MLYWYMPWVYDILESDSLQMNEPTDATDRVSNNTSRNTSNFYFDEESAYDGVVVETRHDCPLAGPGEGRRPYSYAHAAAFQPNGFILTVFVLAIFRTVTDVGQYT